MAQDVESRLAGEFDDLARGLDRVTSRSGLTALFRRACFLLAVTRAPAWESDLGDRAASLRRLADAQFAAAARKINRRAAEIGAVDGGVMTTVESAGIPEARSERGLLPRLILVAVDGSELADRVEAYTSAIAEPFGAHLTVVRVLQQRRGAQVDVLEFEMERVAAQRHLETWEHRLGKEHVSTRLVQGGVPEQILRATDEGGYDLVLLSSHGQGGISDWPLGRTAQRVVQSAGSSVLVVPARAPVKSRLRTLFVGLDGSQRTECVLPMVAIAARHHDAEVVLCHVVSVPPTPRRTLPSEEDEALVARLTEHNRQEAAAYLQGFVGSLAAQGVQARARIEVSSRVPRTLREAAVEERADLVVLCAHGQTGDPAEHHGSVASYFLLDPVLPTLIVQDFPGHRVASSATPGGAARRERSGSGARSHPPRMFELPLFLFR